LNDRRALERAIDSRTAASRRAIQAEAGFNVPDDGYCRMRKLSTEAGIL